MHKNTLWCFCDELYCMAWQTFIGWHHKD